MDNFLNFLLDYYIWVLGVLLVLIITVIGFLADNNKKRKKSSEINDLETTKDKQIVKDTNLNEEIVASISKEAPNKMEEPQVKTKEASEVENNPIQDIADIIQNNKIAKNNQAVISNTQNNVLNNTNQYSAPVMQNVTNSEPIMQNIVGNINQTPNNIINNIPNNNQLNSNNVSQQTITNGTPINNINQYSTPVMQPATNRESITNNNTISSYLNNVQQSQKNMNNPNQNSIYNSAAAPKPVNPVPINNILNNQGTGTNANIGMTFVVGDQNNNNIEDEEDIWKL